MYSVILLPILYISDLYCIHHIHIPLAIYSVCLTICITCTYTCAIDCSCMLTLYISLLILFSSLLLYRCTLLYTFWTYGQMLNWILLSQHFCKLQKSAGCNEKITAHWLHLAACFLQATCGVESLCTFLAERPRWELKPSYIINHNNYIYK